MARARRLGNAGAVPLQCVVVVSLACALNVGMVGCGTLGALTMADPATDGAVVKTVAGTNDRAMARVVVPLLDPADFLPSAETGAGAADLATTQIALADGATAIVGAGARADGDVVTIDEAGSYLVSGTLADGQLVVDAPGADVRLVLDDACVTRAGGAALYVADAGHLDVTLATGSENSLETTGTFSKTDDEVDAAVFSHDGVTIGGEGGLTVSCAQGSGIVSKDELVISGGLISVSCSGHALCANDWVAVTGGNTRLSCERDAVHVQSDDPERGFFYLGGGALAIARANDGVHASGVVQIDGGSLSALVADDALHADADLQIAGGSVTVTGSHEGIEAATVTISGAMVSIAAADDGINATGAADADDEEADADGGDATAVLTIAGGSVAIDSAGDGIDTNGDLVMVGGSVAISAGTSGSDNTAIDYVGSAVIDGGTIVACGRAAGAQTFEDGSAQSSALVTFAGATRGTISLSDAAGNRIVSFEPAKPYESVVISTPSFNAGGGFVLSCGDVGHTLRF